MVAINFSEELKRLKDMFDNLITNMESIYVNYKLYPNNQTYNNTYNDWVRNNNKCAKDMATLNIRVNNELNYLKEELNKLLLQTNKSNKFSQLILNLFNKKNTSNNMKIDNMSLYNYQILLNWEMFIGMFFLFLCLIFYYRKYYDTKQVFEYTKQQMNNLKDDVSNNIKIAKEEITKMTEPPQQPILNKEK